MESKSYTLYILTRHTNGGDLLKEPRRIEYAPPSPSPQPAERRTTTKRVMEVW
jgi:hypothetical protein